MTEPDKELAAILLTHGQPVEVQVRAWLASVPAGERTGKLFHAYLSCRNREEALEAAVHAFMAGRDEWPCLRCGYTNVHQPECPWPPLWAIERAWSGSQKVRAVSDEGGSIRPEGTDG